MVRLQSSGYSEKETVYMLLGELVESHQKWTAQEGKALPFLVTTFALAALNVINEPSHPMYPMISSLITLKPIWNPHKLVRFFVEGILLSKPSEDSDTAPWRSIAWLLEWLFDGLRTYEDGEVLRRVGGWEALAAFGAHPALGATKARITEGDTDSGTLLSANTGRMQASVRSWIVKILGRAVLAGQAEELVGKVGVHGWLDGWRAMGWIDGQLWRDLKDGIAAKA